MSGEERRGRRGGFRHVLALGLFVFGASACAPAFGVGALALVVGVGALTSHCYDYLDVTVLDPEGRKTCDATVTAKNSGDEFELKSCYYAPLTDGTWTIRAHRDGIADALSTVVVNHSDDCTRHVQSMELTLGSGNAMLPATPPSPPPPPPAPAAAPPPAVQPLVPPAPPPSQVPATPPSAPAPASSATAPVGVFPDQPPSAGSAK